MAGRLFRTDVVLEGNATGAVSAVSITRESLRKLRQEQNLGTRAGRRFSRSLDDNTVGMRRFGSQISDVSRLFGGLTTGLLLFEGVRLTDQFDDINARLRVVTNSTAEYVNAQTRVFDISQETFTSLRATSDLYGRLERSLDNLNVSQERTLELARTINQSFQVSGATTQEAAASAIQLAQGLAAGALRGDEFRSVSEQGIRVLQALREGLGKTQGELRKMANAGELTTERVLNAIESQAAKINEEFAELPLTMARASQQLQNAVVRFLGETNQTVPVVRLLAKATNALANNINLVFNSLIILAIAWKTRFLVFLKEFIVLSASVSGRMAVMATVEAGLLKGTISLAGGFKFLNVAMLATSRVLTGLLLLAGRAAIAFGPLILILGAVAGAVFSFRGLTREIGGASEGLSDLLDTFRAINAEVDEFSSKEILQTQAEGLDKLNELLEEQLSLRQRIQALESLRQSRLAQARGFGIESTSAFNFDVDPESRRKIEVLEKQVNELSQEILELAIRSGRAEEVMNMLFTSIADSMDRVNSKIPTFVSGFSNIPRISSFVQVLAERLRDLTDATLDKGLGSFADDIERLMGELDPMAKIVFDFKKEVKDLQKEFDEGGRKDITGFRKALEILGRVLRKNISDEMEKAAKSTNKAQDALEKLQQATFKSQGELDPLQKEVAELIKEQDRLFDLLQKAGPKGISAYNQAMLALNKTYQISATRVVTYSDDLERLFKIVDPTAEDIAELETIIVKLSQAVGDQHPIFLQSIALLERLSLAYASAGHGADSYRNRLGLFGGRGEAAIEDFPDLLEDAFDKAVRSRSFKAFFKAIEDGFREAAAQGADELAEAFAEAASFAAFAVERFRDNPDAPLRALTEVAAQIPGVVGAVAQAALAVDSIFGGRLLGTNFEVSGSGRNLAFGPGGFGGSTFIEEERQRSFFRGRQTRRTETELDPTTLAQLDDFFDQVAEAMQGAARELGVNVPMLIAGEFAETFDEDGNLVSSVSRVLGRTFTEGFEQFTQRVLAENILAVIAQSVGDVEVTRPIFGGGPGRGELERFFGGGAINQIIGETTVLMNEVQAIAERWRDDAELLLEGAEFLLLAQAHIQEGIGLLLDEGGLTATTDLVEELSFAGESLSDTFLRLIDSVSITEDVIELFMGAFNGTREEFVRFSDDLAQAAGGIERLRTLFDDVLGFFFSPEEALQFRIQGAQRTRNNLLGSLGIDPNVAVDEFRAILADALANAADPETIAALLEAGSAIAHLADLEQQLADIRQEAIDAQFEAAREAQEALEDIMRDVDNRIAENTLTEFQRSIRELVIDFHDMTNAAIEAGAGLEELTRIEIFAAHRFQQLVEQLRLDTLDIAAQLFGTPLEEIEQRIAELQSRQTGRTVGNTLDSLFKKWEDGLKRIREFLDDLLLDPVLSPLNPRQRLNEAERQFFETLAAVQSGDVDALSRLTEVAQVFLQEAESFFPRAGSDFRGIFDQVTSLLAAVGIPTGVAQGDQTPGIFTTGDITLLADLITQRDAILAERQAIEDARLFGQLFNNIRDLLAISNQPLANILGELGIDPFELVERLGIDLDDLSAFTDAQLRDLANNLGVEFTDLGDVFERAFGDLTDPNSRVNNALENTIDALPPDIRNQLRPLLQGVENAVTEADARAAIQALEDAVSDLPPDLQLLLAPFLPNIDAVTPIKDSLNELRTLNVTQNLALANLQSIAGILGATVVRNTIPLPPVGKPDEPKDDFRKEQQQQQTNTLLDTNRQVLVEIQRLLRDGLPTDANLSQETTAGRIALATEFIADNLNSPITRNPRSRTNNVNSLVR